MHEDRWDRCSCDEIHHTIPCATTGFGYLLTPSSVHIAQPPLIPGYLPPYIASPGMYTIGPQPHVIMPVISLSNLVEWKMIGIGGGNAYTKGVVGQCVEKESASAKNGSAVEGSEKLVHEKKSGEYFLWEECYDEEVKRIWIHMDTEKRTREDPYWYNSSSGDRIHYDMPSAIAIFPPSSVQIAQPSPTHGPPLYVATPYVYAAVQHPLAFMPPPLPITIPVVPKPTLVKNKANGMATGKKADKKGDGGQFVGRASQLPRRMILPSRALRKKSKL